MLLFELEVVRFPPGVEEDMIEDEVAWPVDFEGVVSKEEDGEEFVTAAIRVTDRTTITQCLPIGDGILCYLVKYQF